MGTAKRSPHTPRTMKWRVALRVARGRYVALGVATCRYVSLRVGFAGGIWLAVAEEAAQDLAGSRLGDLVDELDETDLLVGGNLLGHVVLDPLLVDIGPW